MRQRSMAFITFNWSRLMCPLFVDRYTAPSCWKHASGVTARKMSATSKCDWGKARYEAPLLPVLHFAAVRSSSGLSIAEIMPMATLA